MVKANRVVVVVLFLLLQACSNGDSNVGLFDTDDELTLKNRASFPVGNVVYTEDDARFMEYQSLYQDVSDIMQSESDYVGHDEIFRIRETHPTPFTANYQRLDAFVDFAASEGYRIHGHNLFFYADIGPDSWIAEYRKNKTWTQEQWLDWFEQYVKDKVGRYKGRVASWDVVNEPLRKILADDPQGRDVFIDLAGADIYAKAFQWAREADPDAKLILNEFILGPGGTAQTDELIALADEIGRKGGKVDVIGFESIFIFSPLIFTSYEYNYECFKKAADAGYMVTISELNVAINTIPAFGKHQRQTRLLHAIQRKAFNNIVRAYMDAVPEAQRWGIATWGVTDYYGFTRFGEVFKSARVLGGGSEWPLLWNDDLDKKPAYFGYISALAGVKEPFIYASVYDEGDLVDDQPLSQDFRAELLQQLEDEYRAIGTVSTITRAEESYYNAVKREIESSPDQ